MEAKAAAREAFSPGPILSCQRRTCRVVTRESRSRKTSQASAILTHSRPRRRRVGSDSPSTSPRTEHRRHHPAMDPSGADEDDASAATFFNHAVELAPIDNRPAKVRRLSMEEDYLYEQVMTFAQPPSPPAYHVATHGTYQGPSRKGREAVLGGEGSPAEDEDVLPRYYCDVHMETVFQMKMEIEDAVKRAEYRNWRTMFVVLHGTALHIYGAKDKGWSWSKSRMHGPDVKPDNPPWLRKGALERSYSLQHADVGIAADYHKYVA